MPTTADFIRAAILAVALFSTLTLAYNALTVLLIMRGVIPRTILWNGKEADPRRQAGLGLSQIVTCCLLWAALFLAMRWHF